MAAICALFWFITCRRVRGWGRLLVAASEAPHDYKRWIATGEKRAFAQYRQLHPKTDALRVIPLIVGEQGSQDLALLSAVSLRAAFGPEMPIYSIVEAGSLCRTLPAGGQPNWEGLLSLLSDTVEDGWLFPVLAGDEVSGELPDILQRATRDHPNLPIWFWDEDTNEAGDRRDPWIKPDWDELLFKSLDKGLAGASIVSLAAARSLFSSATRMDAANLQRLLVKLVAEDDASRPGHIPLILTHRCPSNALVAGHAQGREPTASQHRHWPSVSIIVPTRDRPDLLAACVRGLKNTRYSGPIEWVVIDNGSVDGSALQILSEIEDCPYAKVVRDGGPFNFSRLNNDGAIEASGEYLCFLNNDVEPLDGDWLARLVERATDAMAGAVGALLLYPSGRIQHAGVAIGIGGAAGHVQKGVFPRDGRFWTWHRVSREVSAVTAAVMVVQKHKFFEVGGFDAEAFPVAFNDVDLCLRLKKAGLRNFFIAEAQLIHRESESRGDDRSRSNVARYARELTALQDRWGTAEFVDPHFSTLFSKSVERCVLIP